MKPPTRKQRAPDSTGPATYGRQSPYPAQPAPAPRRGSLRDAIHGALSQGPKRPVKPVPLAGFTATVPRSGGPVPTGDLSEYPFYRDTLYAGEEPLPASWYEGPGANLMMGPRGEMGIEVGDQQPDTDFSLAHEVGHDLLLRGVADALRQAGTEGYPAFRARQRVDPDGPERDPEEYAASNYAHGMLLRRNHPALTEREVADLDRLRPGLLEAWRHAGESPAFRRAP